ncbi:Cof-type HAD-IIB family hydrolase [Solibacillus sp. CAU 1738]|uniref:Cof-type HAD-IIB family hydrolase n=1 Tax=Solibacillus sp. CAU 1738 TaxID=3140363 RepID=UPI003261104D
MKKILFFDVDGTLYNSEKKLPDSAREAIMRARANGHEIAIATGRAPFMIQSLLEELDIDTFVTFNGQYVVYKGEVVFTDGISTQQLEEIIDFGAQREHPVVFLNEEKMIASLPGHASIRDSLATLHYPYPEIAADFYHDHAVYQTLIFMEQQEESLYKEAFPNIEFVRWHEKCCDMLPKGGSKARGIEKLIECIGLKMEDTIAFGDGLNDVEMLQAAGIGVVMGNGHTMAKRVADIEAPHVDDDGLYKIMETLQLI